jgi:hypothetical protein
MPGIGATLREARERAHLDIMDLEARTKIRAKYLRALEDEEWGLLPGYTFAKGFLRTYADMLGLDGRVLVDEFKRQYRDPSELEAPPLSPAGRREHRRARERAREPGGDRGGRARPTGGPGRPPIVIVIAVLVVLLIGALYAVGVLLPRKSGAPTTPLVGTTATTTTSHGGHAHGTTSTPKVVGLKLAPTGPVYVCLVGYPSSSNDHKHVRLNGVTLTPGAREPVRHDNHFHVTFGNNSVVMYVNGHRHSVPPTAVPVSYDITLHGRVLPLADSKAPHCA